MSLTKGAAAQKQISGSEKISRPLLADPIGWTLTVSPLLVRLLLIVILRSKGSFKSLPPKQFLRNNFGISIF